MKENEVGTVFPWDYWAPAEVADRSIVTHVDYFLQDFISTSDYVSLFGNFGNVSLDFFLDTHASALLFFFFFFFFFGCPGSSLLHTGFL